MFLSRDNFFFLSSILLLYILKARITNRVPSISLLLLWIWYSKACNGLIQTQSFGCDKTLNSHPLRIKSFGTESSTANSRTIYILADASTNSFSREEHKILRSYSIHPSRLWCFICTIIFAR